ncbi:MAG: hypothetical protein ACYDAG_08880 [Chloroflexota bacterium]
MKTMKRRIKRCIRLGVMTLLAAAVAKEMSMPEEARPWHGRVLGVPYDFRPPTAERFREAWWNDGAPLFTATPWGLGWTLNPRRAIALARRRRVG